MEKLFSFVSFSWDKINQKKNSNRILMLGLDSAGKTTILYKMKLNEEIRTIPTLGFNVEKITTDENSFIIWDLGGQKRIRSLWTYYYENCQGLLYVVDSSDRVRLSENRHELINIMKHPQMRKVPVVILANKQDIPESMTSSFLSDQLCLREILNEQPWFVQGCCAKNGEGLASGMSVLNAMIKKNVKTENKSKKVKTKTKLAAKLKNHLISHTCPCLFNELNYENAHHVFY